MFLDEKTVLEILLNPGLNFNHLSRNLAQVINRDLKNAGTKLFFTGENGLRLDLTKSLLKHLLQL